MIAYHNSSSISAPHALDPSAPHLAHAARELTRHLRCDYE
jgi:hypothetical protein